MTPPHSDLEDRIELRALVEEYGRAVDAKDVPAVVALYTEDGRMLSHLLPGTEVEPFIRTGHDQLRRALDAGLAMYLQTTHIIGGQVLELEGATARGSTVCLAHHVYEPPDEQGRRLLVMAIRYEDRYAHRGGLWRFSERRLRLEWREDRALEEGR
ncbi:MAG TPA: nuclear transport factor 2 family protein [Acidimicrobiales bacterium]|nr:nuclear transport factor 2 family protein [Acidimicrobiales bacterium]